MKHARDRSACLFDVAKYQQETENDASIQALHSLGVVEVPVGKLWGAQTQRSLEHFSIGKDLILREMIPGYAVLKKAAATANHAGKRLEDQRYDLIVRACDEILAGEHHDASRETR